MTIATKPFDVVLEHHPTNPEDRRVCATWDAKVGNQLAHRPTIYAPTPREAVRRLVAVTSEHNGVEIAMEDGPMRL